MNISRTRKTRGITQEEMADLMGVSQGTISNIESGHDGVTLRKLQGYADALEIPLWMLFADSRDAAEETLLNAFRSISEDRQLGWLDMAAAAKSPSKSEAR